MPFRAAASNAATSANSVISLDELEARCPGLTGSFSEEHSACLCVLLPAYSRRTIVQVGNRTHVSGVQGRRPTARRLLALSVLSPTYIATASNRQLFWRVLVLELLPGVNLDLTRNRCG